MGHKNEKFIWKYLVPGAVLILAIEFTDAMCTWKRELDDEKIENLKLNNVISSQSKNDAGGNEKIMDSLYLENKLLKDSIDLLECKLEISSH